MGSRLRFRGRVGGRLAGMDNSESLPVVVGLEANPPVGSRKETFLPPGRPSSRSSRISSGRRSGMLLDETTTIGTRAGWQARLRDKGFTLHGHRLVRMKRKA